MSQLVAINEVIDSMKFNYVKQSMNINESMIETERQSINPVQNSKPVQNFKSNRVAEVDAIADRLVNLFEAPQSRQFFLKCGWHLSQAYIERTIETATRRGVRNPLKYFVASCANEMRNIKE